MTTHRRDNKEKRFRSRQRARGIAMLRSLVKNLEQIPQDKQALGDIDYVPLFETWWHVLQTLNHSVSPVRLEHSFDLDRFEPPYYLYSPRFV
jgi:hypothetical protein